MGSIPYEKATSGDQALNDVRRMLEKFGCQSFGSMTDNERGCTIVQFKHRDRTVSLEASWKEYAAAWQRAHPRSKYSPVSKMDYDDKALKIGKVAVCSVLRDWIKGQITAVECGILSFDAVFMPHMLLPTGDRLIDRITKDGKFLPGPSA